MNPFNSAYVCVGGTLLLIVLCTYGANWTDWQSLTFWTGFVHVIGKLMIFKKGKNDNRLSRL